jgi:hypothetical protein
VKAKSIRGTSVEEIADGLAKAMADGYKPTVAIVFLSIRQDRDAIRALLDEHHIDLFGATTAGEFIDGEVGEFSTAVMLIDLPKSRYRLLFGETGEGTTRELAARFAREGMAAFPRAAFIVAAGGISTDGEMVVRGIEDVAGGKVTIFGGLAGDDFTMSGTFVFSNEKSTNNGLVALVLDEDHVEVHGLATSGWTPVGTVRTITHSVGNVVFAIDDKPALDVVIKFMGVSKDIDAEKEVIVNIGSEFPMQIQRDDGPPVIRAPLFANKADRSLICAGSVPQGSRVRFSMPPDFDVVDKVIKECEALRKDLPRADAMIMFSCKARHLTLGPLVSDEIQGVKDVWDSPLVGFFSYGEMGKAAAGKHEFHNNTCSLVVLREK